MLIFIALSLALCYIAQTPSSLSYMLMSPYFIVGGLVLALASSVGMLFKKLPDRIGYESFSCSTLLLWFAYWKPMPLFNGDSPIFFFFPLYFALMSAFLTLFLSNQGHKIDKESLKLMRRLDKERIMPAWSLMLCVLASLEVTQHYQLFPVMMTLLMLRFAFANCVQND
jgi:hypothetical protein